MPVGPVKVRGRAWSGTGQVVKVYLAKKKETPKTAGKKDKVKDDDDIGEKRIQAKMVVVVSEPPER